MKIAAYSLIGLGLLLALAWVIGPRLLVSQGDMREPRSEIYAARLGDTIYTAGGIGFYRTLSSCTKFDTDTRKWSDCPDLPRALHHVAMAAGDDRVFASGGYASLPFNIDQNGAVFVLEEGAERWVEFVSLPHPLGQHTMSYHDGALWLVGGEDGEGTLATVWRLDLTTREWSRKAPMDNARHSHAVALDGEALYVSGGRSDQFGSQSASAERYDFADNVWATLPDMPEPLAGHGSAVIGGHLHVYGGENLTKGIVDDRHDVLDLETSEWTSGPPLPEPRHGFASAEVGGTIWVLGGGKHYGMWTPLSVSGTALPVPAR